MHGKRYTPLTEFSPSEVEILFPFLFIPVYGVAFRWRAFSGCFQFFFFAGGGMVFVCTCFLKWGSTCFLSSAHTFVLNNMDS